MQMQPVPQQPGKPALRSGIVIGIALGIIHSVIVVFTQLTTPYGQYGNYGPLSTPSTILYLIIPLVWLTGFLIVGFLGGKASGKVGTGTLAGLFGGLFGGILASVGQIVATAISINMQANQNGGSYLQNSPGLLLGIGLGIILPTLILTIGGGSGIGALGGLLGQSLSNVRPQPPVAAFPVMQPYPPMAHPYQPMAPFYAYPPQQPAPHMPPTPQPPSENISPS